jgi:ActR/RegA family two-component response regulator
VSSNHTVKAFEVLTVFREGNVYKHRVLLADDNKSILAAFREGLESRGFEVVPAVTVKEALRLIATEKFDVLVSDLHMPGAGDGLTVVSAMRHAQPKAVTLVQSGYPAMEEAITAILLQADEILVKPVRLGEMADIIEKKLSDPTARMAVPKERVAAILERDLNPTIQNWLARVRDSEELVGVTLGPEERTGHLPLLLGDLIRRLRLPPTKKATDSRSAREHGTLRRSQGYSISMLVEESRILQVSIFSTLQANLGTVDFSTVLLDVMTIADEVDSQLRQAVIGFLESSKPASVPEPTVLN